MVLNRRVEYLSLRMFVKELNFSKLILRGFRI
jgi:hypothetical protein